jgi:PAS domain S-box-containing protein
VGSRSPRRPPATKRTPEIALEAARYTDLYDLAPVAYFTFDAQGVIQEVNRAGAALLGVPRSDVVGSPFAELVAFARPGDDPLLRHLRRCAEERSSVSDDLAFSTKRGPIETQAISVPVLDPTGGIAAFRTAFIDVSERNEALRELEKALRSEQALRCEIEHRDRASAALADALATSKSQTQVLQIMVEQAREVADADYAALGVSQGPDRPFDPFVSAGIDERVRAAFAHPPRPVGAFGLAAEERRPVRLRDVRESPVFGGFPPGHPVMTSFLGIPVMLGDHVLGGLYVANKRGSSEFTEDDQRALERFALRAGVVCEIARLQGAAQEAVRSRDLAAAIVSHDLRNPLSTIGLACAAMVRGAPGEERRRDRRRIDQIKRAAEHMRRLIDDMFTATMIESGRLSIRSEPTPLPTLFDEARQVLGPTAEARSVRLDFDVEPGLPPVHTDRERILQAVSNLVGNALKFSRAGQTIRVHARRQQGQIVVSVTDEGPGIAPDRLPHIFERYSKGDHGRAGAGLGLYIVQGIVAAHGGRVWAESPLGEGSRFSFTLPTTAPS